MIWRWLKEKFCPVVTVDLVSTHRYRNSDMPEGVWLENETRTRIYPESKLGEEQGNG